MEIECKFVIPDEEAFERLLQTPGLARFTLSPASVSPANDRYLDTAGCALQAGGFALRERRAGSRTVLTLKGLGRATGAIHRREEFEVELPAPLTSGGLPLLPGEWPSSRIRDLVLELVGSTTLQVLFEIEQARHTRLLYDGSRAVAEVSLDRVAMHYGESGRSTSHTLELEAELLPTGSENDLADLVRELQDVWRLPPETRSKYERALERQDGPADAGPVMVHSMAQPLTVEERVLIERLALEREVIARRARLLLAWDEGVPRAELVERSGLSSRRVRHWLGRFSQVRLGVFPAVVLDRLRGAAPVVEPAGGQPGNVSGKKAIVLPGSEPAAAAEQPARAATAPGAGLAPGEATRLSKAPGIEADDPMSEAGRKTLRFHYQRMLFHEPGTRSGEDIEALHDMRVATRRMRAAFGVFEPYFEQKSLRPLLKGLRRTGQALGTVRDLDVFGEKARAYLDGLPEAQKAGLDGLLSELDRQRAVARDRMIAQLDSGKHRRFVEEFGEFVSTPGLGSLHVLSSAGEPRPYRVRHVVPMVIYERLAEVQGYDEWVTIPNPPLARLHALRIACKRLRYSVEYFMEVLGPGAKGVVKEIVAVQDHLGAVQDAVVASGILRDYLACGTWGDGVAQSRPRQAGLDSTIVSPGVAAYLAAKHVEMQQLLDAFPSAWLRLQGPQFSQMVAQAVMTL